jgi:hypothetical protein
MPRLNPFAFPSDTTLRFGLLSVFILCGTFSVYGDLRLVFRGSGDPAARVCASETLSRVLNLTSPSI